MPSQVKIIQRRNSPEWDRIVADVINRKALREKHTYYGITNQDRADQVRRAFRTAGKRLPDYSVHAFWTECHGCDAGGAECRYHVDFSVFTIEEARAYKAKQAQQLAGTRR